MQAAGLTPGLSTAHLKGPTKNAESTPNLIHVSTRRASSTTSHCNGAPIKVHIAENMSPSSTSIKCLWQAPKSGIFFQHLVILNDWRYVIFSRL